MTAPTTPRKKEWWEQDDAPQFEYVPVEPRGLSGAPQAGDKPERTWGEVAKDRAIDLAKGVVGTGEAAVGLADLATGGRAGKFLQENLGYNPQATNEWLAEQQSAKARAAQQAMAKVRENGGGWQDYLFTALENPDIIAQGVTESLPLMGAGGAAGRAGLTAVSKAAGKKVAEHAGQKALARMGAEAAQQYGQRMGQKMAQRTAQRYGTLAGGFGEGLAGAGSAAEQMRALLDGYEGRIKLIYMDPPFMTGDRFYMRVRVGEEEWRKGNDN